MEGHPQIARSAGAAQGARRVDATRAGSPGRARMVLESRRRRSQGGLRTAFCRTGLGSSSYEAAVEGVTFVAAASASILEDRRRDGGPPPQLRSSGRRGSKARRRPAAAPILGSSRIEGATAAPPPRLSPSGRRGTKPPRRPPSVSRNVSKDDRWVANGTVTWATDNQARFARSACAAGAHEGRSTSATRVLAGRCSMA